MFDQTFVNGIHETKKPTVMAFSLLLQTTVVCILASLPLIYTQVLPSAQLKNLLIAPTPPVPATPQPHEPRAQARSAAHVFTVPALVAPARIPKQISQIADAPAPDVASPSIGAGSSSNAMSRFFDSIGHAPAPPLPGTPQTKSQGPVKIGGNVAAANVIRSVQPVYPPLAKAAGVQGTVEFTATISKEGKIENLTLVRGHPLLIKAASDAVLQWRYRPTLLNGQPVEVVTDIIVNFTLRQ